MWQPSHPRNSNSSIWFAFQSKARFYRFERWLEMIDRNYSTSNLSVALASISFHCLVRLLEAAENWALEMLGSR